MEKEKIVFKGSHPDSLYRVPADSGAGAGKMARLLRVLRWPLALVLVCVALAVFVYFLMPSNLESDLEIVNSTYWERNSASVGAILHREPDKSGHKPPTTTTDSAGTQKRGPSKTQEIDFYEADSDKKFDLISVIETITENKADRKLPIPPVFPEHIAPEVQYGNEKADTDKLRTPKVLDEENGITSDSTVKPHITQQPEKPLAIYFKDATTESITRAETINDFNIYDEKVSTKNGGRSNYKTLSSQGTGYTKPQTVETAPDVPPEVQEYYGRRPSNVDVHFTSGHSKFFGIGIEDAEKMQSTTQSSLYNTRVSPTLPTWRDGDDTTTKKYPVVSSDVPQCHSPRLDLCRGVLPYDLAGEAAVVGGVDVTTLLPQIDYLVGSNCSDRVRQFVCALLEPECSPAPYPAKLPCYNLCQAIRDSCDGYVPRVLFPAFNCRQYGRENCVGARAPCSERELACSDGTCVLRDWVCDGTQDCPAGEDEKECSTCAKHEFDCQAGSCIPKQWLCDGYKDCPKGEDEAESTCKDVEATPRDPLHGELGEESAGSAPAPAVRRPNRLPDARIGEHDSSKELLITSDSSNALKRNFTRRPSPSRLTPYRPKLRHPPPSTPHTEEDSSDEKTEKPMPPVRKTLSEVKAAAKQKSKPVVQQQEPENREFDENINVDDLGLFEDFGTERKDNEQPTIKPVLQQRPKSNKEKMDRPAIDVDKSPVHVDGLPYPSPVYVPSSGPMRLYSPPAPPTLHPPTRLDKSINQFEKIIDGAALLRKAAAAAAEEARLTANTTEGYEDDYPRPRGRTSHTSPCPSGELRCVDGRCITLAQLCDGTIDCTDHADEDNCFT